MACFKPNICKVLRAPGRDKCFSRITQLKDYEEFFYLKRHVLNHYETHKVDGHFTKCLVEKVCLVPCGNCLGCSLDYSKDWSNRLKMEYLTHIEKNDLIPYFVTFTYSDDYLPKNKQLNYLHINSIIKSLSDKIRYRFDESLRYFVAGEYGSKGGRPHFHGIFWVPVDFEFVDFINQSWLRGFVQIKCCFFEHFNYISHYSVKKMALPRAKRKELILEGISFEKSLKSRGLGYDFLNDHFDQIVKDGFVVNPNSYNFKNIDEFNLSFSRSSFSPGRAFMKVAEKIGRKAELELAYKNHFRLYKACMTQNQINSSNMLTNYLNQTERLLELSLKSVKRLDL